MYFKFVNWSLGVIFSFASFSQRQNKTKAFSVYYEYFHIDVPYEKEGDVIDVIDDGGGGDDDDDDGDVSSPLQSLDPSLPPAGLIYLLANRMRPQAYTKCIIKIIAVVVVMKLKIITIIFLGVGLILWEGKNHS